jgi:hypothetical protein
MLRLAMEPRSVVSASSHQQSRELDERVKEVQQHLGELWTKASNEGIEHLILVLTNNPLKDVGEVLRRPDVQEALSLPFERLADPLGAYLSQQFRAASADSAQRAGGEVEALGVAPKLVTIDPEDAVRKALIDLQNNAARFRRQVQSALSSPDEGIRQQGVVYAGERAVKNAQLTGEWVIQKAVNDTRVGVLNTSGVKKMWLSNLAPEYVARRCEHCRELHGEIRFVQEEFTRTTGRSYLPVHGGSLFGPPRHPNCRCVIVPWLDETNAPIKSQAVAEAIAQDAPPPGYISSDTLRALPQGLIEKFIAWLTKWLVK